MQTFDYEGTFAIAPQYTLVFGAQDERSSFSTDSSAFDPVPLPPPTKANVSTAERLWPGSPARCWRTLRSSDGVVRFAEWPEGVIGHFIARLPPEGYIWKADPVS